MLRVRIRHRGSMSSRNLWLHITRSQVRVGISYFSYMILWLFWRRADAVAKHNASYRSCTLGQIDLGGYADEPGSQDAIRVGVAVRQKTAEVRISR